MRWKQKVRKQTEGRTFYKKRFAWFPTLCKVSRTWVWLEMYGVRIYEWTSRFGKIHVVERKFVLDETIAGTIVWN